MAKNGIVLQSNLELEVWIDSREVAVIGFSPQQARGLAVALIKAAENYELANVPTAKPAGAPLPAAEVN